MLFIIFLLTVFALQFCTEPGKEKEVNGNLNILENDLLTYNQEIVQAENQEITDFINRYQWKMITTSTGLRFMSDKNGKGPAPIKGSTVTINYSVKLLSGEVVFQSDPVRPATFIIGKRRVASGLEEGVMLMHQGDRAKLIVPSHLAYGLLGDLDKIPNRAILVYDVELNQVSNPNN